MYKITDVKTEYRDPILALQLLRELEHQKSSLHSQMQLGIITIDGAKEELSMLDTKTKKLKEDFVLQNHVTASGTKRSISFHPATAANPKEYYVTKLQNGNKVKAVTYEGLINKLFSIYAEGLYDFSFKAVFTAALREKAATENPSQKTLIKNEADFKRMISERFAKNDIRQITEIQVKQYIQEWVTKEHPKKKAYLAFKGVLNLTFNYAKRHKLISENPLDFIKNAPYLKSCDTRKAKPEEKILSPDEIKALQDEIRKRMTQKKYGSYYINGYALLFEIETGLRVGELCAVQWSDIGENAIHIHSQQLNTIEPGGKNYFLAPYTKNEKGISEDGRYFPLTRKIKALLDEIREKQNDLGIRSNFVFCHEDGEWIKTDAYLTFLNRICRSQGLSITNNHAFRMSLNSNVLIPMGVSVADRAAMLGHSIETNLRNYSFAKKDYIENVKNLLDMAEIEAGNPREPERVIDFQKMKNRKAQ